MTDAGLPSRHRTVSFGVFTDPHYGRAAHGNRDCAASRAKLAAACRLFARRRVPLVLGLGDLVDNAPEDAGADLACLAELATLWETFPTRVRLVLGNHDVTTLSGAAFADACGRAAAAAGPCSCDLAGVHIVLLDGNRHADGRPFTAGAFDWCQAWLGEEQLAWLAADLAVHRGRHTVVCCHPELLNPPGLAERDPHVVCDHAAVQDVLRAAGNVRLVLCGHYHPGRATVAAGIPHVSLAAMCTGDGPRPSACAVVTIARDGAVCIEGYGRQASFHGPPCPGAIP